MTRARRIVVASAVLIASTTLAVAVRAEPAASTPRGAPVFAPTLLAEADARAHRSPIEGRTGFALARVRPGLGARPTSWLRAVATLEAVPNVGVLDAFANVQVTRFLDVEVGQSRPPTFASFRYEPVHTLPFPDRSPVVSSFRVRRDVGASVHLSPTELPLESWVRVGSGSTSTVSRTLDRPALYAMLDLVLGRAHVARGEEAERQTFGLRLGGSGYTEYLDEAAGVAGATPTGFVFHRPVIVSGDRVVGEVHAVVYAGPVRLMLEAAVGREARARDVDGDPSTPRVPQASVISSGTSAEVAWVVLGRPRTVASAPSADGGAPGALEIAARYDALALGRGALDVAPGGYRGGALSVKWYVMPFAAVTVAGYLGGYDVGPIEDPLRTDTFTLLLRGSFYWNIVNPTLRREVARGSGVKP